MKPYNRQTRLPAPPDRGLFILCGCFALGMVLAYPIQRRVDAEALTQLGTYVQSYARLAEDRVQQPASILSAAAAYLRYPLLAFLCGLSGAGVVLIPLLCGVQGFFLSFSVCCWRAAGRFSFRTSPLPFLRIRMPTFLLTRKRRLVVRRSCCVPANALPSGVPQSRGGSFGSRNGRRTSVPGPNGGTSGIRPFCCPA